MAAKKSQRGAADSGSRPGERAIIAQAQARFAASDARIIVPLGDDAAVLRLGGAAAVSARRPDTALAADLLVEGVHFCLRYMTLADAGYKALAVNLSDLAAMGARPSFAVASLGVPPGARQSAIDALLTGVQAAAAAGGIALVGGDTVAAPQWVVGFTVLGELPGPALTRTGARPGDELWHSGSLGLSQAALHLLWGGARTPAALRRAHLRPQARLALGWELRRRGLATACLDLSDSLAQCALLLAEASGVGLALDFTGYSIPAPVRAFLARHVQPGRHGGSIPAEFNPGGRAVRFDSSADYLLGSAEDYELLFTAAPQAAPKLAALSTRLGLPLTRLGRATSAADGRSYVDETGSQHALRPVGFEHGAAH